LAIDVGTPVASLVDDPTRVGVPGALGIDETYFLKASAEYLSKLVTDFVDVERRVLIEMVNDEAGHRRRPSARIKRRGLLERSYHRGL
jgi:hypothetical protein